MHSFVFILLLLTIQAARRTQTIKIISIEVPKTVIYFGNVSLYCNYSLESDQLYSLKWYKRSGRLDQEFFSYIPNVSESTNKAYPTGIHLDENKSLKTGQFLSLYNIDLDSEGLYICEVSADHTFQTEKLSGYMTVLVPPSQPPQIRGHLLSFYRVGEDVNISCLAPYSKPKSTLKWFINDAAADEITERNNQTERELVLVFTIKSHHFVKGKLHLRCTSYIEANINGNHIRAAVFQKPKIHLKISSESVSSETVLNGTNEPSELPKIVGLKSSYAIGDVVDVNCTMSYQSSFSRLDWFIQDEKASSVFLKKYPNKNNSLGLMFTVRPYHLDDDGNLKIRCSITKNLQAQRAAMKKLLESNFANANVFGRKLFLSQLISFCIFSGKTKRLVI